MSERSAKDDGTHGPAITVVPRRRRDSVVPVMLTTLFCVRASDCSLYDEDDYDSHHSRLPVIINCVSSSGVLGEKYEEAR